MCITENVGGKIVPLQTIKAYGGLKTEAWLLNDDTSSRKKFINGSIISTCYPLQSNLHWKPHTRLHTSPQVLKYHLKSFCKDALGNSAVLSIRLK